MNKQAYTVRNATPGEFEEIGKLLVKVYSQLEGFPKESEQPNYYKMLANIGELTTKPGTELLVVVSPSGNIAGAVVYFTDMKYYGSGGTATNEKNACGFRLLAVDPLARGQGIGKLLTDTCIQKAKDKKVRQLIIHSTKAMQTAWAMYEKMGFRDQKTWILCRENFLFMGSGYGCDIGIIHKKNLPRRCPKSEDSMELKIKND